MADGVITEDGVTNAIGISNGPIKISLYGDFIGASVQLQELIIDTWYDMLDETTVIPPFTAPSSFSYNLFTGDSVRFSTSGADPSTSISWAITTARSDSEDENSAA